MAKSKRERFFSKLEEDLDTQVFLLDDKKDTRKLFLRHFSISSFDKLIGRKLFINYVHRMTNGNFMENEIVFTISSYKFEGNLYIPIPNIQIDGRYYLSENCMLEIFPSNDGKIVLFSMNITNDVRKSYHYATEKENDEQLKAFLI